MSTVTRPRGPLPARVYWVRRGLLLLVLGSLVVGFATLLGLGGGDSRARTVGATPRATQTAAPGASGSASPSTTPTPSAGRTAGATGAGRGKEKSRAADAAAQVPQGPCRPADLRIGSRVTTAYAGTTVSIPLELVTLTGQACTWRFSAETVAMDIRSGEDAIWSSRQCPKPLGDQTVVVQPSQPAEVVVKWRAQRADEDCTRATPWVAPGWYHVLVAPTGGEPTDQQFELTKAPTEVRTRKPKPSPTPEADSTSDPSSPSAEDSSSNND